VDRAAARPLRVEDGDGSERVKVLLVAIAVRADAIGRRDNPQTDVPAISALLEPDRRERSRNEYVMARRSRMR